jgi:hypothetical protein
MIKKQMQFDGSLGPTKLCPIKQGDREIDDGGIKAKQFVLKPELFLSSYLTLATLEQLKKDLLVKLPGAMPIRIPKSGTARGSDSKMLQFTLAASQPSGDFPERMSSAKLTEEHGDKLTPASESSGMTFGFRFLHGLLELNPRKQL